MPDYKAIAKIKDSTKGYEFHCLDPPEQWRLVHYLPSSEETIHRKDLLGCLEKAIEYVHQHNIDAVIFCSDYSSLMAAALCQETGLPGPSFESKFLCMHKYYSRKAEPSRLWYGCVSVDKNQNVDINSWVKYPCYVKPTSLTGGLIQFKAYNESELQQALATHCRCLGPQFDSLSPLVKSYLDENKYPLATSKVSVVEELVEGASQHFLDGWVDNKGNYHMWASFDLLFYSPPAVFGYVTPSQESASVVCAMKEITARAAKSYKLKNTFLHTELWKRGSMLDIVEMDASAVAHSQYTIMCTTPLCTEQQPILPVGSTTNVRRSLLKASLHQIVLACRSTSSHSVKGWHRTFSTSLWLALWERERVFTTATTKLVFDSSSRKIPGYLPHRPTVSFLQASTSLVQPSKKCVREGRTSSPSCYCSHSTHLASVNCDSCYTACIFQ